MEFKKKKVEKEQLKTDGGKKLVFYCDKKGYLSAKKKIPSGKPT